MRKEGIGDHEGKKGGMRLWKEEEIGDEGIEGGREEGRVGGTKKRV